MATISPQEAKRVVVAALLCAQVPISTIARAMIYAVKRRLESGDPSDSLSSVEAEACKTPYSSPETLKASIRAAWAKMSKDYIIKICNACRPRLEAIIEAEGGHIEGQNV